MTVPRPSGQQAKVLLVEGQDDKHVVLHLRDRDESIPQFHIVDKEGIDNLLAAIALEVRVPGREVVGIVVDADNDPVSRWQAVASRLVRENIQIPGNSDSAGTIINGTPRIGIWIMPDNRSPGELEDFVATMIPEDDPIWPRSEAYIDGIPVTERRFSAEKVMRAKIYAWLATRNSPGRMGSAIGARELRVFSEPGISFSAWLGRLFG